MTRALARVAARHPEWFEKVGHADAPHLLDGRDASSYRAAQNGQHTAFAALLAELPGAVDDEPTPLVWMGYRDEKGQFRQEDWQARTPEGPNEGATTERDPLFGVLYGRAGLAARAAQHSWWAEYPDVFIDNADETPPAWQAVVPVDDYLEAHKAGLHSRRQPTNCPRCANVSGQTRTLAGVQETATDVACLAESA